MHAVIRFRVDAAGQPAFVDQAREASVFLLGRPGCESAELVQALDDPDLWALISRWSDVGSYRRAYNGYDAKVVLTPLMVQAIDEPTAYAVPDAVGPNVPRGEGWATTDGQHRVP